MKIISHITSSYAEGASTKFVIIWHIEDGTLQGSEDLTVVLSGTEESTKANLRQTLRSTLISKYSLDIGLNNVFLF
jgi:hypothetical protein